MTDPALRERLINGLARASRGTGVTRATLIELAGVRDLGYVAVPGSRVAGDLMAAGAWIALVSCIDRLADRGDAVGSSREQRPAAEVCEVNLGLGEWQGKGSLDARRAEAARRFGRTGRWYADQRSSALGLLADELLLHRSDPVDLSALLQSPFSMRTALRETRDELQRTWQNVTVHLDERGTMTRFTSRIRFRALRQGVARVSIWHEYYRDPRPGVVRVLDDELIGAQLLRESDFNGAHVLELAFDRPLTLGETRELVVPLRVSTDVPAGPRVYARDVRSTEGLRPAYLVRFHPRRLPLQVWWFSQAGLGDEYECPTGQELRPNSLGEVYWEYEPIPSGGNFGIAWRWD